MRLDLSSAVYYTVRILSEKIGSPHAEVWWGVLDCLEPWKAESAKLALQYHRAPLGSETAA